MLNDTAGPRQSTESIEGVTIHLLAQVFADYVWICVTEEDAAVKPGVVLLGESPRTALGSTLATPSNEQLVDCDVLLGVRDDPLTLILSRSLTAMVGSLGESRQVLLAVSVAKTGKVLQTVQAKAGFLREVVAHARKLLAFPERSVEADGDGS